MKQYKTEKNGKLEVGQVLYTKRFTLTVDRNLCKGCELCRLACPRWAISLIPVGDADGKAVAPLVDVDEKKCDYHGICAAVCPFSAISITVNGDGKMPSIEGGAFPTLTRDIEAHSELCEPGCKKCEESCPLGAISAAPGPDGGTVVNIRRELCAGCQICRVECPANAIDVTKFIEGSITIAPEICPDGCHRCFDVCPVDALALGEDGKTYAKDIYCIFCGACLQVCPAQGALNIERTVIRHTGVESGAWNRGLERLTSTAGLMRELAANRAAKVREAIKNLEAPGETE